MTVSVEIYYAARRRGHLASEIGDHFPHEKGMSVNKRTSLKNVISPSEFTDLHFIYLLHNNKAIWPM